MKGYVKSLIGAKASTIGLKVATAALNTALSIGISAAISGLIALFVKLINAKKEAREKAIELANAYKDQSSTLDSQIKKYKELSETLKDENLSVDENLSIKKQLADLQEDLIKSYGEEATNIDIVNGKYQEQLNLLENLSKEKAREYVSENKGHFEDAKDELEKKRSYSLGDVAYWDNYNTPKTQKDESLIEFLKSYSDLFRLYDINLGANGIQTTTVELGIVANAEEAYETLHQFYYDLEQFGKENDIDVSSILESVSNKRASILTDELKEYREIYDEYANVLIMGNDNLRPAYKDAIEYVEKFNSALKTGEGYTEAKNNLESLRDSLNGLVADLSDSDKEAVLSVFDKIFANQKKSRESEIADLKKQFGLYQYDKTLETFFSSSNVDIERFKEIASVCDTATEAIRKYNEERNAQVVADSAFSISEEDAKKLSDYQSKIDSISKSLKDYKDLETSDITKLMADFHEYANVFEQFGVTGVKGEGYLDSALKAIAANLKNNLKKLIPEMSDAIDELFNSAINPEEVKDTPIDWLNNSIDNLQAKVDAANRNLQNTNGLDAQKEAIANLNTELSNLQSIYSSASEEYNKRYQKALAEIAENGGNAGQIKSKIETGDVINIEDFSSDMAKLINNAIDEWNNKRKADDKVIELGIDIQNNNEKSSDFIMKYFDNQLSYYENQSKMIEAQLANAEARGYMATQSYYKALKGVENKRIETLNAELAQLTTAFDDSNIDKNSDKWYELQNNIEGVNLEIQEAQNNLVDFENQIRQIDWDMFDFARDQEAKLMGEADFMIDLLDSAKLFSDAGEMTAEGLATMGLHAQNYNAYLEQSIAYAEELAKRQAEIEAGSTDKAVIDRYNELLELRQESILSAEAEKDAMIDLVSEGIEKQKDAFNDLIAEYEKTLDLEKDIYSYQKKNAESTKRIAQIQKQIAAYSSGEQNDETRAKLQKLRVELDDAQGNLEDQQYDRYLSDQKEILSTIQEDYNTALDSYLDNTAKVITDSIDVVNNNATNIGNTLATETEKAGYEISGTMEDIWTKKNGALATGFNGVKENVADGNGVLTGIQADNNKFAEAQKNAMADDIEATNDNTEAVNSGAETTGQKLDTLGNTATTISGTLAEISGKLDGIGDKEKSSGGSNTISSNGVNFKYQKNQYTGKLNTEYSIVDRLKSYNFDPSYDSLKSYYAQMGFADKYSGTAEQNIAMLEWMKKNYHGKGYASGGFNLKKQLAWTQEDGTEYIIRPSDGAILTPLAKGDSVLNSEATKNLWNMANNPVDFIKDNLSVSIPNVPVVSGNGTVENSIQMSISLPGVTNYQEFVTRLQTDKKFEKMIVDVTSSALTGSNTLSKYRHKF